MLCSWYVCVMLVCIWNTLCTCVLAQDDEEEKFEDLVEDDDEEEKFVDADKIDAVKEDDATEEQAEAPVPDKPTASWVHHQNLEGQHFFICSILLTLLIL